MGGARYDWWSYAKSMVKRYPKDTNEAEANAVREAMDDTARMEDGAMRMAVIDMVLIRKTHTVAGAALQIHVCERVACQWHADFIRLVGRKFKCDGLL